MHPSLGTFGTLPHTTAARSRSGVSHRNESSLGPLHLGCPHLGADDCALAPGSIASARKWIGRGGRWPVYIPVLHPLVRLVRRLSLRWRSLLVAHCRLRNLRALLGRDVAPEAEVPAQTFPRVSISASVGSIPIEADPPRDTCWFARATIRVHSPTLTLRSQQTPQHSRHGPPPCRILWFRCPHQMTGKLQEC